MYLGWQHTCLHVQLSWSHLSAEDLCFCAFIQTSPNQFCSLANAVNDCQKSFIVRSHWHHYLLGSTWLTCHYGFQGSLYQISWYVPFIAFRSMARFSFDWSETSVLLSDCFTSCNYSTNERTALSQSPKVIVQWKIMSGILSWKAFSNLGIFNVQ